MSQPKPVEVSVLGSGFGGKLHMAQSGRRAIASGATSSTKRTDRAGSSAATRLWGAARFGLLRCVWHPALFVWAIYMVVLSSIVLLSLPLARFIRF